MIEEETKVREQRKYKELQFENIFLKSKIFITTLDSEPHNNQPYSILCKNIWS